MRAGVRSCSEAHQAESRVPGIKALVDVRLNHQRTAEDLTSPQDHLLSLSGALRLALSSGNRLGCSRRA